MRRQVGNLVLMTALLASITASASGPAGKIRVVNEGGIRDAWMLPQGATLPVPAYPQMHARAQAEVCVAIGYLLNPDGTTSDFALLKGWSAAEPAKDRDAYWAAFAKDAANALAHWRFLPRPGVRQPMPVYTVATFLFGSNAPATLRKRCAINDAGLRLAELKRDGKARQRMAGQDIFDRLDIEPRNSKAAEWRPHRGGSTQPAPIHPAPGEPGSAG